MAEKPLLTLDDKPLRVDIQSITPELEPIASTIIATKERADVDMIVLVASQVQIITPNFF